MPFVDTADTPVQGLALDGNIVGKQRQTWRGCTVNVGEWIDSGPDMRQELGPGTEALRFLL